MNADRLTTDPHPRISARRTSRRRGADRAAFVPIGTSLRCRRRRSSVAGIPRGFLDRVREHWQPRRGTISRARHEVDLSWGDRPLDAPPSTKRRRLPVSTRGNGRSPPGAIQATSPPDEATPGKRVDLGPRRSRGVSPEPPRSTTCPPRPPADSAQIQRKAAVIDDIKAAARVGRRGRAHRVPRPDRHRHRQPASRAAPARRPTTRSSRTPSRAGPRRTPGSTSSSSASRGRSRSRSSAATAATRSPPPRRCATSPRPTRTWC